MYLYKPFHLCFYGQLLTAAAASSAASGSWARAEDICVKRVDQASGWAVDDLLFLQKKTSDYKTKKRLKNVQSLILGFLGLLAGHPG